MTGTVPAVLIRGGRAHCMCFSTPSTLTVCVSQRGRKRTSPCELLDTRADAQHILDAAHPKISAQITVQRASAHPLRPRHH